MSLAASEATQGFRPQTSAHRHDAVSKMAADMAEITKTNPDGEVSESDLLRKGWSRNAIALYGEAATESLNRSMPERAATALKVPAQPAPPPSIIPEGLKLLAADTVDRAAKVAAMGVTLGNALNAPSFALTLAEFKKRNEEIRQEAGELHALGDAIAHNIAELQKRHPLRGNR